MSRLSRKMFIRIYVYITVRNKPYVWLVRTSWGGGFCTSVETPLGDFGEWLKHSPPCRIKYTLDIQHSQTNFEPPMLYCQDSQNIQ